MAPLLINKMALSVFLLPAITIMRWRVAPRGIRAAVRGFLGRCCRACTTGGQDQDQEQEQEQQASSSAVDRHHTSTSSSPTTIVKPPRLPLDNMTAQNLTWFDLALVFGPHVPLLLPLVLATLFTSRWAHQLGVQELGMVETRFEQARPSTWYVLMGVTMQQALSMFLFAGAGLHGWRVVVVGGSLVCAGCLVIAAVPIAWLRSASAMCQSLSCRPLSSVAFDPLLVRRRQTSYCCCGCRCHKTGARRRLSSVIDPMMMLAGETPHSGGMMRRQGSDDGRGRRGGDGSTVTLQEPLLRKDSGSVRE